VELAVVNVHGTSGFTDEDTACRVEQFKQIFEDRGDGMPAAYGARNLVLGDLNTDPLQFVDEDASAAYWAEQVGDDKAFHFISCNDAACPGTYAGLFRIDHVASDSLEGRCVVPGATPGTSPVFDAIYWDHRPVVCDVYF